MKWLLAALVLAIPAGAQVVKQRAACNVVTQQEAESLLGPKAMQHSRPGICAWNLPDSPLVFVVVLDYRPGAKQSLSIPRQGVPKMGGVIREEPSLGAGAFSASAKGTQNIYMIKGDAVVSVSITNDNKGVLGDYLDRLRPIAKRVASRL